MFCFGQVQAEAAIFAGIPISNSSVLWRIYDD